MAFGLFLTACGTASGPSSAEAQNARESAAGFLAPEESAGRVSTAATQAELPYFGPDRRPVYCFYEDINYQGQSRCYVPAATEQLFTPDFRGEIRLNYFGIIDPSPFWNDRISSVKILNGWTLALYEDADYKGRSVSLTGDVPDLRSVNFNDIASSNILSR